MKNKRIMESIVPSRYRISIHPNFDDHTFKGEETIYLKIRSVSRNIELHSVDLKLSDVFCRFKGGESK
ncbi:MAG: hypothetical protein HYV68_02250, partial [Candidatus Taylorbacteria bacterium]|nr:hypothetical protein [Candidatus Taylorbacteria bacterium]